MEARRSQTAFFSDSFRLVAPSFLSVRDAFAFLGHLSRLTYQAGVVVHVVNQVSQVLPAIALARGFHKTGVDDAAFTCNEAFAFKDLAEGSEEEGADNSCAQLH